MLVKMRVNARYTNTTEGSPQKMDVFRWWHVSVPSISGTLGDTGVSSIRQNQLKI